MPAGVRRCPDSTASRSRRLAVEYLFVFFVVVAVYVAVRPPGGPILPLVLAAGAVVMYLRRQATFDRQDLFRAGVIRSALPGILLTWVPVSLLLTTGVAVFAPARLFDMPRERTALWAAIVILYPIVSVYPQELLFRAFLLHRYAGVFDTGRRAAAAGAVAFGFAHLLFGNVLAVVATLAGGWLFARRYQRTRSLMTVSVEHALYGITIFTVGLGDFFYHGGQR
jgi:membrane protease YdiL (CAAX protease family)